MSHLSVTGPHACMFWTSTKPLEFDKKFASGRTNFIAFRDGLTNRPSPLLAPGDDIPHIPMDVARQLQTFLHAPLPIHVSIRHAEQRRTSGKLLCSIHPEGVALESYVPVDGQISIAIPELALLQTADLVGEVELAVLCSIFFGLFTCDPCAGHRLVPRRKLTCKESLSDFLASIECTSKLPRGALRLQRAIGRAVENAASPEEIRNGLRMKLPTNMGGFGLHKLLVNHPVNVAPKGCADKLLYPDFLHPALHACMEYDSLENHSDAASRIHDPKRYNALAAAGYRVYTLTSAQTNDPAAMRRAVEQFCGKERAARIPKSVRFLRKQEYLWHEIDLALSKYLR